MSDTNGKPLFWTARERKGFSREEVARLLDPPVSMKTLERWEKGVTPIKRWRLEQLARVYGQRASELLEEQAA